jgi:hypothetical protein
VQGLHDVCVGCRQLSEGMGRSIAAQRLADCSLAHRLQACVQAWGAATADAPLRAVLAFTDPSDWSLDLQLCADAVLGFGIVGEPAAWHSSASCHPESQRPRDGAAAAEAAEAAGARALSGDGSASTGRAGVRIIAAQNDLLWSNGFPVPRFGLGAFVASLRTLVAAAAASTGRVAAGSAGASVGAWPEVEYFGKPTAAPYRLAERLLRQQIDDLGAKFCSACTRTSKRSVMQSLHCALCEHSWRTACDKTTLDRRGGASVVMHTRIQPFYRMHTASNINPYAHGIRWVLCRGLGRWRVSSAQLSPALMPPFKRLTTIRPRLHPLTDPQRAEAHVRASVLL